MSKNLIVEHKTWIYIRNKSQQKASLASEFLVQLGDP